MTSHSTTPQSIEIASSSPSGDAGSPQKGEPVFLAVGKLRRPHGLHGEIIMDVLTPEQRSATMARVRGKDKTLRHVFAVV
jgi:hypothetical protein